MRKILKIKQAAAMCLAVVISISAFGICDDSEFITGFAEEESQPYSEKLEDLQKEQDRLDKEIAAADEQISKEQDNLDAINKKYTALQEKIQSMEQSTAELEDQMVELDSQMRETMYKLEQQNTEIDAMREDFLSRIRVMYVAGGTQSYTNVLINSEDFYDILMRMELVKRVAKHDNDELNRLLEKKAEIEQTQTELDSRSQQLKAASQEYSSQMKELSDEQAELLKMQEESSEAIANLQNNKEQLASQSQQVADEYAKVSSNAETTATTTTKKTAAKSDATTTKKSSGSETEKSTTTKKQTVTSANNDSQAETTTKAKTTTTKPQTTTQPATTTAPPADSNNGNSSKAQIVVNYAKSMVGGSYVWGGSSFGATDCSGLVMLSYQQVGINLPHQASAQAYYGTTVSYSNMQEGDLIFFGGSSYSSIYHVAIYIGNGKMVHAENSYTGIVISNVASFSIYNNITTIKRLL